MYVVHMQHIYLIYIYILIIFECLFQIKMLLILGKHHLEPYAHACYYCV